MSDGRYIDPELGLLLGEAAQQGVGKPQEYPPVFGEVPNITSPEDPAYYNVPVLKRSVWTVDIPAYYYVGGATGASMVLGSAALALNREALPALVHRSRWIGMLGGLISSVLLIHDLGRPERFLYMLRVFRPTSPMNVGSWILSGFSSLAGLAWLLLYGPKSLRRLGDAAAIAAGVFGLGLAGYTGVLVSHTAVPIWQMGRRVIPLLFLSSATASAASLFEWMDLNESEQAVVRRYALAGKVAELLAMSALERSVGVVPKVAAPLSEGFSGFLWRSGRALGAAGLVLSAAPGESRFQRRTAGLLGTLGAFCVRFGIHYAGHRSAQDPRATFHQQRAGYGGSEVSGATAERA